MDMEFSVHPEADTSWQDEAICKGLSHVFFGPAAERPERRVEREAVAKAYCRACPVMLPCRRTARLNREHGVWGGENDEERAAAGYAPRSPSRRAVLHARDRARQVPDDEFVTDEVWPVATAGS
jgi:WhiB family transcriptional regulator, redox-sensing transcriptional regulator